MDTVLEALIDTIADGVQKKLEERWYSSKPQENEKAKSVSLLTTKEVCSRLKVAKGTLARHIKLGYLTASYYVGRSPRFTEADIDNYLNMFNYKKEDL